MSKYDDQGEDGWDDRDAAYERALRHQSREVNAADTVAVVRGMPQTPPPYIETF